MATSVAATPPSALLHTLSSSRTEPSILSGLLGGFGSMSDALAEIFHRRSQNNPQTSKSKKKQVKRAVGDLSAAKVTLGELRHTNGTVVGAFPGNQSKTDKSTRSTPSIESFLAELAKEYVLGPLREDRIRDVEAIVSESHGYSAAFANYRINAFEYGPVFTPEVTPPALNHRIGLCHTVPPTKLFPHSSLQRISSRRLLVIECPRCLALFSDRDDLHTHFLFAHLKIFGRGVCRQCDIFFSEPSEMVSHFNTSHLELFKLYHGVDASVLFEQECTEIEIPFAGLLTYLLPSVFLDNLGFPIRTLYSTSIYKAFEKAIKAWESPSNRTYPIYNPRN